MDETSVHVRRALNGDMDSLDWTVRRLSPLLLLQATHRLRDRTPTLSRIYAPEDLVNDTWCVALPRLSAVRPRDERYTPVLIRFLGTILLNRFRDIVRRHIAGKPTFVSVDTASFATVPPMPAETASVVTSVLRREREGIVLQHLEMLPPADRALLVVRGIEHRPVNETARVLGIQPNTLTVRYRRLLQRLREDLPRSVFDDMDDDMDDEIETGS